MNHVNQTLLNQTENVLSDRYKLITTQDVLEPFLKEGYEISSMNYGGKRGKNKDVENTHGAHVVRLRHEALKIGNDYIEAVISNSYNGSLPFEVSLGIFRLVCSNGLVVGNSIINESVKHVGSDFFNLTQLAVNKAFSKANEVKNTVESLKSRTLSDNEILELAYKCYKKRLENVNNLASIDLLNSIRPLRDEDRKKDAFTILNVIQEYSLRGGIKYSYEREIKDDNNKVIDFNLKHSTTKAIFQPKKTIEYNKFIFDQACKLVA